MAIGAYSKSQSFLNFIDGSEENFTVAEFIGLVYE
jgi:hypothetical protein